MILYITIFFAWRIWTTGYMPSWGQRNQSVATLEELKCKQGIMRPYHRHGVFGGHRGSSSQFQLWWGGAESVCNKKRLDRGSSHTRKDESAWNRPWVRGEATHWEWWKWPRTRVRNCGSPRNLLHDTANFWKLGRVGYNMLKRLACTGKWEPAKC